MLGTFTAVYRRPLWSEHHSTGESQVGTILSPSLWAHTHTLGSSQHLSPPVKRMTKDLSYAGSKNQILLLAFSFVASRAPCPPLCTPAPGWKPSLHLSYCLKPKFTVSVGGKTLSFPSPRV